MLVRFEGDAMGERGTGLLPLLCAPNRLLKRGRQVMKHDLRTDGLGALPDSGPAPAGPGVPVQDHVRPGAHHLLRDRPDQHPHQFGTLAIDQIDDREFRVQAQQPFVEREAHRRTRLRELPGQG